MNAKLAALALCNQRTCVYVCLLVLEVPCMDVMAWLVLRFPWVLDLRVLGRPDQSVSL